MGETDIYFHLEENYDIDWKGLCDYMIELLPKFRIHVTKIAFEKIQPDKRVSIAKAFASARIGDLLGTKDHDGYYHARVAIFSYPSIISVSGFSFALAREPEYYIRKMVFRQMNDPAPLLTGAQLTEILKGYVLQMAFL